MLCPYGVKPGLFGSGGSFFPIPALVSVLPCLTGLLPAARSF